MFYSQAISCDSVRVRPKNAADSPTYSLLKWQNTDEMHPYYFERTLEPTNLKVAMRSSWTHRYRFNLFSDEIIRVLQSFNWDLGEFSLLKYETGDFFKPQVDSQLSLTHKYTCLLFVPYESYEGGDLLIKSHASYIQCYPSSYPNSCTMVIFSNDMIHEVLPIIKGTRYVFKAPVYEILNKSKSATHPHNYPNPYETDDVLCDEFD